jgi:hypothetical protein
MGSLNRCQILDKWGEVKAHDVNRTNVSRFAPSRYRCRAAARAEATKERFGIPESGTAALSSIDHSLDQRVMGVKVIGERQRLDRRRVSPCQ